MNRTEWDWLIGKPTDETMLVIDDGVIAMLDEYVKKKCAEAFKRGAEAMREAARMSFVDEAKKGQSEGDAEMEIRYLRLAGDIRALPDPEDRS